MEEDRGILTNAAGKPMDEWIWPDDFDQFFREQVAVYKDDAYIVEDLMGAYDWTDERARGEVRDLPFLLAWLKDDGFLSMLQDRTARETVKTHILRGDTEVIDALVEALKALRPRKKPGPRARLAGKYYWQEIADLYFNRGKGVEEIAKAVYGDASEVHNVRVQISKVKRIERAKAAAARAEQERK